MAVRISILVAVLMALYGCGLSPETKDSSEGLEPLGSEASVFGAAVLTGQNVELEINVVELADRPGQLLASVYLECGYDGGGPCLDDASPSDGEFLMYILALVGVAVVSLVVGAFLLLNAFYLIRWLLSEAGRVALRSSLNRFNRFRTVLTANSKWLRTAWIGLGVLFFVMVVVPGALLIYHYSGIGD